MKLNLDQLKTVVSLLPGTAKDHLRVEGVAEGLLGQLEIELRAGVPLHVIYLALISTIGVFSAKYSDPGAAELALNGAAKALSDLAYGASIAARQELETRILALSENQE